MDALGDIGINERGHGAEDDVMGSLKYDGVSIPGSDHRPLGGTVGVGDGGETLVRDDSVYMYKGFGY